jgi:N-methylhydantoinase B
MNLSGPFLGASESLHYFFTQLLAGTASSALTLPDGTALFVQATQSTDIATLPQASALCHRYLKLANGDVALTNDPYSGGTLLSDFTLVVGVGFHPSSTEIDLLLARRISLAPRLPASRKLDDEGVRVPPTPLGAKGVLNSDLLTAISMHPLAPRGLAAAVLDGLEELQKIGDALKRVARDPRSMFSKAGFQNYIEDSSRAFEALLGKLPLGTANVSSQLSSGEMIKLQLKITEDRVIFDFAGSDNSTATALTELATFGACFAATVAGVDEAIPLNSGTFHYLQVSAPTKTVVSATAPNATLRGMSEGAPTVSRLCYEALAKLQTNFKLACAPESNGCFQIQFDDGRILTFEVPPGGGATATLPGIDGATDWSARNRVLSSPEQTEHDYPVEIKQIGQRKGSGGAGKNRGGNGSVVSLKVNCAGELKWLDSSLGRKFDGCDGGRAGLAAIIEVQRLQADGTTERSAEKELTKNAGAIRFAVGDQVTVLSGGGGGFTQTNEAAEP